RSATRSPAASANPSSRAATSTAQSTSGTNAALTRSTIPAPGLEQRCCRDERAREVGDLAVLIHRSAAQQHVVVFLGEVALLHQDRFCLVDDLAFLERELSLAELG